MTEGGREERNEGGREGGRGMKDGGREGEERWEVMGHSICRDLRPYRHSLRCHPRSGMLS